MRLRDNQESHGWGDIASIHKIVPQVPPTGGASGWHWQNDETPTRKHRDRMDVDATAGSKVENICAKAVLSNYYYAK
jgi:hypothetical protein